MPIVYGEDGAAGGGGKRWSVPSSKGRRSWSPWASIGMPGHGGGGVGGGDASVAHDEIMVVHGNAANANVGGNHNAYRAIPSALPGFTVGPTSYFAAASPPTDPNSHLTTGSNVEELSRASGDPTLTESEYGDGPFSSVSQLLYPNPNPDGTEVGMEMRSLVSSTGGKKRRSHGQLVGVSVNGTDGNTSDAETELDVDVGGEDKTHGTGLGVAALLGVGEGGSKEESKSLLSYYTGASKTDKQEGKGNEHLTFGRKGSADLSLGGSSGVSEDLTVGTEEEGTPSPRTPTPLTPFMRSEEKNKAGGGGEGDGMERVDIVA